MATSTLKAKVNQSMDAKHVLKEAEKLQTKLLAEGKLYRSIVEKACKGEASEDDQQAGRILASKLKCDYQADVVALRSMNEIRTKYPNGFESASAETWRVLTEFVAETKRREQEFFSDARERERTRQILHKENVRVSEQEQRLAELQARHQHLIG